MKWQEHADRTLYVMGLGACQPHVLDWMEPVKGETPHRLHCSECNGDAWVNLVPSVTQRADPDEVIDYVEKLIHDKSPKSTEASGGSSAGRSHGAGSPASPDGP